MSFLFPRTIRVSRVQEVFTTQEGLHQAEVTLFSNIRANIQLKSDKGAHPMGFPSRTNSETSMTTWNIFFDLPLGSVNKSDKITDDAGQTYEVTGNYWNSLGYNCECRIYIP